MTMKSIVRDARGEIRLSLGHKILWWCVLAGVAIAAVISLCAPAHGHGDASWITANPETRFCCGPQDCAAYPASAVARVAGGYLFKPTGEFIAYAKARVSIDERFWACRPPDGTGNVICFWAPAGSA